jgi:hypothetical protein
MAEGTLKGSNSLMTMDRTRAASALGDSYLSERKARGSRPSLGTVSSEYAPSAATVSRDIDDRAGDNTRAEAEKDARDAEMGLTTSKDVRDLQRATSFQSRFGQAIAKRVPTVVATALAPALAPAVMGLTAAYGAFQTGLGLAAAGMESLEEGAIGDALDSRKAERARDALESSGYSYGESSSAVSGGHDAPGTGGTPTEGAATEMGRASGDSGLGDAASGKTDAAGDEGGGADSGGDRDDGSGHGARGGGSEGTSEAGGIGGY